MSGDCVDGEGVQELDGVRTSGTFREGRLVGAGTRVDAAGNRREATFHCDIKRGHGTYTAADGRSVTGTWCDDRFYGACVSEECVNGEGVLVEDTLGRRYEGMLSGGIPHGRGVLTERGMRYEGEFWRCLMEGEGRLELENGEWQEGRFASGSFNRGTIGDPEGPFFRGTVEWMVRHGTAYTIRSDGKWHRVEYDRGVETFYSEALDGDPGTLP